MLRICDMTGKQVYINSSVGAHLELENAFRHAVIKCDGFRMGKIPGGWVWHQLQVDNTIPLIVGCLILMFVDVARKQFSRRHARQHEVPEFLPPPIVGAHMPSQAIVDQRNGDDRAFLVAAAGREVVDLNRPRLVDGAA